MEIFITIGSALLVMQIKMCVNETYNKVRIGKHLHDNFSIQNGLLPLLFNFQRAKEINCTLWLDCTNDGRGHKA
jgi:hypothetical protein